MKYEGYFALAHPLAELMIQAWPKWQIPVDLVIPIPLHSERKRQRGYNQAELLVEIIQPRLEWECNPQALRRHRRTAPQVGLDIYKRRKNVQGAFAAEEMLVSNRRILLVDDVCTTGSTLEAAASVLLEAGAESVAAYCLTRVSGRNDISPY
jgi:ComF family protein